MGRHRFARIEEPARETIVGYFVVGRGFASSSSITRVPVASWVSV
ncbi:hypothetical protein [Rhodococcus sp. IEGM 1379]|nr:hypothetical protein [Rhodococcus sp. IEGM 1379]MDI9918486.1 hypothetical protein [Rhodococcus sp. IEGM 1379]